MIRSLARYSMVVIGMAVWAACYRLSAPDTLRWVALVWLAAGLCEAMMHFRPFWPRCVKCYMAALTMFLAFAVYQGLRVPHAGLLLHGSWFPALCAAAAAALFPMPPAEERPLT